MKVSLYVEGRAYKKFGVRKYHKTHDLEEPRDTLKYDAPARKKLITKKKWKHLKKYMRQLIKRIRKVTRKNIFEEINYGRLSRMSLFFNKQSKNDFIFL